MYGVPNLYLYIYNLYGVIVEAGDSTSSFQVRDSRENYSSKSSGRVIVSMARVCQTMPG